MLGKLYKYEAKATARLFVPLYGVLLIFAILNRLMDAFASNSRALAIPNGLIKFAFVFIIIAISVLSFVVLIQRMYKSLLGDEGYLMFTLPVKPWHHLLVKSTVSMFWMVISGVISFVAMLVWLAEPNFLVGFGEAWQELLSIISDSGMNPTLTFFNVLLMVIVSLALQIFVIYAAICLGHLASKHKILASFGAYMVLCMVGQAIVTIIVNILSKSDLFYRWIEMNYDNIAIFNPMLFALTALSAVLLVACFAISNYILTKKLNLE